MEEENIRQELARLTKMVQQLLDKVEGGGSFVELVSKGIWDDSDLMRYLRISISTVKRFRKDGTFKSFRVGKGYRYYRDDILPLRDRFLK